jgi:hypothetical protein
MSMSTSVSVCMKSHPHALSRGPPCRLFQGVCCVCMGRWVGGWVCLNVYVYVCVYKFYAHAHTLLRARARAHTHTHTHTQMAGLSTEERHGWRGVVSGCKKSI